jgi:predicted nucleic acid-binding protein
MRKILIDTSVWIEYFRNADNVLVLDELINQDRICINEIILAELIPFLEERKEKTLIDILQSIDLIPLQINWNEIIEYQIKNLKNNIRKIGIPDLLIIQNVIKNDIELLTLDRHFILMKAIHKFNLY